MRCKGIGSQGFAGALLMSSALVMAGLVLPVMTMGAAAQTGAAQGRQFSIQPQPLQNALTVFGQQAGIQVSVDAAAARGVSSPGVSGTMSPEAAVASLLAGTGLNYRFTSPATVLISSASAQGGGVSADDGATVLDKVTLQGQGAVTEGTNSYTADWMRTANGLALTQKETPQSTSVVTRQMIEDRGMANVKDVMQNSTGVTVNQYETDRFEFYSRGFQIDSYQYDGVPTTLDSTYQYGDGSLDTVIYDHIEIVRGATGLMQNTGEPGASVNFIRKRPASEFQGYISGLAGTQSNYRGELDVSGPLNQSGTVRARVTGALQTKEDTIDLYKQDKNVIYGVIEADVTDSTTVTVGANRQGTNSDGVTWAGMPAFDSNGNLIDWAKGSTTGADWTNWDTTVVETFASVEHTFDNDWKARFSVNHLDNDFSSKLLYVSGNPDPVTGLGTSGYATRYKGDRVQDSVAGSLNGDFELFDRTHQFVTGFFASQTDGNIVERTADSSTLAAVGNIFAWDGSYPEPVWNTDPSNVTDTNDTQFGTYGAVRFSVTDPLAVTVGSRVSWWSGEKKSYWENFDYGHYGIVTPYFGVTYDLTDQYTLYASYTNIFKPQTYQDEAGNYLDPAKGHNYEVGIKSSWIDGRVNASFAVFQTNQDNVAEYSDWDAVNNRSIYRSIDGTTTRGFEIEVAGEVHEGLNVFGGYTFRNSQDDDGNAVNTFQPRNTLKIGATYTLPGQWQKLTVGATARWQSETKNVAYYLASGQSIKQGNYAIFDAMARYKLDDKTSLNMNVYNIADERYFRTMGFYDSVFYGEGRTATLTFKREF
jgi:outer membrane receptor for ferric coprogen and ferric-rhodotorulic acid